MERSTMGKEEDKLGKVALLYLGGVDMASSTRADIDGGPPG